MKRIFLMISIFVVNILSYNGDEIYQEVEIREENDGNLSSKLNYVEDDLVYREYSSGNYMEKGCEILIENDNVVCEMEHAQTIVIILDGSVYKEFSFDHKDIEFGLEKNGNYVVLAIDADGNSVDITSIVKIRKSADGGVFYLSIPTVK